MAYFSNGSDGQILDSQCEDCPLGYGWNGVNAEAHQCPTMLVQLMHNYDQLTVPPLRTAMRILVDDDGICQTRKLLAKIEGKIAE